jgi:hypothetical protein
VAVGLPEAAVAVAVAVAGSNRLQALSLLALRGMNPVSKQVFEF